MAAKPQNVIVLLLAIGLAVAMLVGLRPEPARDATFDGDAGDTSRRARVPSPAPTPREEPVGPIPEDPGDASQQLWEALNERPIPWKRAAELAARCKPPLDDAVRTALVALVRSGQAGTLGVLRVARDDAIVDDLLAMLDEASLRAPAREMALRALSLPLGEDRAIVKQLETYLAGERGRDLPVLRAVAARGSGEAARVFLAYIDRVSVDTHIPDVRGLQLALKDDPEATAAFRENLLRAPSKTALAAYIRVGAHFGADALTEDLMDLDHADHPGLVRHEALRGLARIGNEDAIEYLLSVAGTDEDGSEEATKALGTIQQATVAGRARIRRGLEHRGRPVDVQLALIRAAGNTGDADAAPLVAARLGEADPGIVAAAVTALGRIGPPARDHVPAIAALWPNADPALRRNTVVALGGVGGPQAAEALRTLGKKPDLTDELQTMIRLQLRRATATE